LLRLLNYHISYIRKTAAIRKQLPVIQEEDDKESLVRTESDKIAMTPDVEMRPRSSKGRVDLASAEESRIGDYPSLAKQTFIRTSFKQSE
jgi:hypothetical protein